MRKMLFGIVALAILTAASLTLLRAQSKEDAAQSKQDTQSKQNAQDAQNQNAKTDGFKPEQATSKGSVTINGKAIPYDAFAGTLVVHPKSWDDVPQNADKDDKSSPPEASMFYVAYIKSGENSQRPITFLYNGGPGSSTAWLHMGAFGPKRVVTADNSHTPAAPYPIVNNDYSLLDVSDLVFIDAPGTGFSRHRRQRSRKGILRRRCRCRRLRRFHFTILDEVRTLELSQVFVWRELWHHTVGGADQRARNRKVHRLQRCDSAFADSELRQ